MTGNHSDTLAIKATLDDIERLITFKVADRLPLVLVVGQAESEILAEWHHRALTYAVLCVQLGAALIALAFIWTRSYRRAETMARHMTAAFEEKSRESRALLDSIPFPAWLLDNDGHFRAVNEAFCRYVGHDMAHILGKTIFELFPEEEATTCAKASWRLTGASRRYASKSGSAWRVPSAPSNSSASRSSLPMASLPG